MGIRAAWPGGASTSPPPCPCPLRAAPPHIPSGAGRETAPHHPPHRAHAQTPPHPSPIHTAHAHAPLSAAQPPPPLPGSAQARRCACAVPSLAARPGVVEAEAVTSGAAAITRRAVRRAAALPCAGPRSQLRVPAASWDCSVRGWGGRSGGGGAVTAAAAAAAAVVVGE